MQISKRDRLLLVTSLLAVLVLFSIPQAANAVALPCTPSSVQSGQYQNDVFNCVNSLYLWALVASSIAAVFMIILGGYLYIFSGGSESRVGTAKSFISTSLLGIAVLVAGFLVLQQINPSILEVKNIAPPQIGQQDYFDIPLLEDTGGGAGGGASGGAKVVGACTAGPLVPIPKNEFTQYDDNTTCPTTLEALRKLKAAAQAAGVQFKVNDSFGPDHASSCHTQHGTCVDIGILGSTTWDDLCKVVKSTGLFSILNESGQSTGNCGRNVNTNLSTGPHLHLNLLAATSATTNSATSSVSNNNGTIPGISSYKGPETWPDGDWSNTNPALRTAYNSFNTEWQKLGNGPLQLRQVYRPDEYARYIRSLWEYDQLIKGRSPLADLYGCEGFRHITKADLDSLTPSQLQTVKQKIAIHGNVKGPACKSDHGAGIAFDLTPPTSNKVDQWISTGLKAGLCHHIQNDLPHFALKSSLPAGTNCNVR